MSDKSKIIPVNAGMGAKQSKLGKRPVDKEDIKRMGSVIRKYRNLAKVDQKQVAAMLGVSTTAVGNWELGLTRPSLEVVGPLCDYLDIPINELLDIEAQTTLSAEDRMVLGNYHLLTPFNKQTVDQIVERLLFLQDTEEKERLRRNYKMIPLWESSAAAGIGSPLPDNEKRYATYIRTGGIPSGADCIIRVNGASMKPKFPDGCYVYVDTGAEVREGDVGIFIVDGESYIKERRPEGLHSYNPSYKTIRILESTDFRCFGKVVGIVDGNDIPNKDEQNRIIEAYKDM